MSKKKEGLLTESEQRRFLKIAGLAVLNEVEEPEEEAEESIDEVPGEVPHASEAPAESPAEMPAEAPALEAPAGAAPMTLQLTPEEAQILAGLVGKLAALTGGETPVAPGSEEAALPPVPPVESPEEPDEDKLVQEITKRVVKRLTKK